MRLLAVRITNFRSFSKTQEFRFPEEPGLYFLQGLNEVEPRLGANGAGKSTIWEAILWCIFGKTSRGLKAGDVNNWGAGKGTRVEIDLLTAMGEECTVTRTWGPIKWTLASTGRPEDATDLTKAKDNYLLGWLGLEFTPFLNAVLMAQGQPMFLDMKADAQATLFSDVMGLDGWLEASARASKQASSLDDVIRGLERAQSELRGQVEALRRVDTKTSLEAWERDREKRLGHLESQFAGYAEHSTAKEDLDFCVKAEEAARQAFQAVRVDKELLERYNRFKALLPTVRTDLAVAEAEAKHVAAHLASLANDEPCKTCGQRIAEDQMDEVLVKAENESARIWDRVKKLRREAQVIEDDLERMGRNLDVAEAAEDDAWKALKAAEDAALKARRDLQAEERDIDRLEEEYARIEAEVNPYAAMERGNARELDRLEDELADVERRLDDRSSQYGIASFWVRGFKDLRLQQIAEALTELEIEVNSCVAALGLIDWELNFQVDRETKSGSIQRGFSVFVRSPLNKEAVPWEAWSGGEAQRLRLAAQMGLADLIRNRTGATIPLEVWDEPTRDLSDPGVQDLLEALAYRARVEQRQIWLVDHRTHNFGGFTGGATIIKTPSGSRIRQS